MDWTWMGGTSLLIKLSHKDLVETVMVTVIMIVTVDLVMTVAVTTVVVEVEVDVHRVAAAVGTASSVENLVILLGSAHLGMTTEGTDMVVEMTGMVVVAAVVMDLTVVVTGTLAVAEMVAAMEVTATTVTDLVPTEGLDLERYVPSRYESLSSIMRSVIVCLELCVL
jgi:hypothetical protein